MGKVYDKLQRYHPNQRNHLSQNMGKHPLHLCSWFMEERDVGHNVEQSVKYSESGPLQPLCMPFYICSCVFLVVSKCFYQCTTGLSLEDCTQAVLCWLHTHSPFLCVLKDLCNGSINPPLDTKYLKTHCWNI